MAEPGTSAWERRDGEPASHYVRFLEYLHLPPSERPKWLAAHSTWRGWSTADEWRLRAAQFDDQSDIEHAQFMAEQRRRFQVSQVRIGDALTAMAATALAKLDKSNVRPDTWVKILAESRKAQMAALFGSDREARAALRSALVLASGDDEPPDLWGDLTAEYRGTIPPEMWGR